MHSFGKTAAGPVPGDADKDIAANSAWLRALVHSTLPVQDAISDNTRIRDHYLHAGLA